MQQSLSGGHYFGWMTVPLQEAVVVVLSSSLAGVDDYTTSPWTTASPWWKASVTSYQTLPDIVQEVRSPQQEHASHFDLLTHDFQHVCCVSNEAFRGIWGNGKYMEFISQCRPESTSTEVAIKTHLQESSHFNHQMFLLPWLHQVPKCPFTRHPEEHYEMAISSLFFYA